MANVGDVNTRFTAEVGGFQIPISKIKKSLKGFQAELSNVNAALQLEEQSFREGRQTAQQFERATHRLRLQQKALATDIGTLNRALGVGIPKAAKKAVGFGRGSGLSMVRSGMAQVAVTSLGTSSAFGQVAQGMLLLGPGAPAVIAAAAGLAVIAFAYSKLTKKSREAREDVEKTTAELLKASKVRITPAFELTQQAGAITLRRADIRAQIEELEARPSRTEPVKRKIADLERTYRDLGIALAEARTQIRELNEGLVEEEEAAAGAFRTTLSMQAAMRGVARAGKALTQQGRELNVVRREAMAILGGVRTRHEVLIDKVNKLSEAYKKGLISLDQFNLGVTRLNEAFTSEGITKSVKRQTEDVFGDIGRKGGLQLVRGLMQGVFNNATSLADALKRVLFDIFETVAAALAKKFIFDSLFSAASFGIPGLGGIIGSVLPFSFSRAGDIAAGPASVNDVVDFSKLNRHPSPLVQSRDGDWLQIVRASNIAIARLGG